MGLWQLERVADRCPDDLGVDPVGQGLLDGPTTEASQDLVLGHARGVGLAELSVHPLPERSKTHRARVPAASWAFAR